MSEKYSTLVETLTDRNELIQINLTKSEAINMFTTLGFYIEQNSGMCQQTEDCCCGVDINTIDIVTNDYFVFSHYKCDICDSILLMGHISERYENDLAP